MKHGHTINVHVPSNFSIAKTSTGTVMQHTNITQPYNTVLGLFDLDGLCIDKQQPSKSDHQFLSYLHFCTFLANDLETDFKGQGNFAVIFSLKVSLTKEYTIKKRSSKSDQMCSSYLQYCTFPGSRP
jgi:hypothetical protein